MPKPTLESPAVMSHDALLALRTLTPARIALGRSGAALPTAAVLDFAEAHAQARDAVHDALDADVLDATLRADGWVTCTARSRAPDRRSYLLRPDWGRRLHAKSLQMLTDSAAVAAPDVVWVVGDGLSARAAQQHSAPLLRLLRDRVADLSIAPVVIATQARVALADEIGAVLGARVAVILIGERPGLSAADSLGAYITYAPRVGRTDAERVCISNIRPAGLALADAATAIEAQLRLILAARLSGVALQNAGHVLRSDGDAG